MKIEFRDTKNDEIKVETREDSSVTISGYAARFYDGSEGTQYRLWENVYERIMPGAFSQSIKEDDIRALFNHDKNHVLGRTGANTVELTVDDKGLRYDINAGDTTTAKDVEKLIKRGDVYGSSFGFLPFDIEWIDEGDREIRLLKGVKLLDVGPVTFPAYQATSTSVRDVWKDDHDAWKKEKENRENRATGSVQVRLRRLRLMDKEYSHV